MGGRFIRRPAGQHSDLSPPASTTDRQRVVVLTLLAVDGVLSALAAAFFLRTYIGPVPFPISALLSGLVNAALVWAALQWTTAPRLAALPLWCWLLTVAVLTLGGPGDDIVFGGSPPIPAPLPGPDTVLAQGGQGVAIMEYSPLLLIVLGTLPPVVVLWRHLREL
ncbi:MAG TPA: hypothetical protein VHI10_04775 [Mycobacterium sp.]|nr:hypothetical protein [Mycobacterium sp.]